MKYHCTIHGSYIYLFTPFSNIIFEVTPLDLALTSQCTGHVTPSTGGSSGEMCTLLTILHWKFQYSEKVPKTEFQDGSCG